MKFSKQALSAVLLTAMLASGGLGILQKLQQSSAYAEQRSAFLLLAFLFAAGLSAAAVPFGRSSVAPPSRKSLAFSGCVGIFFGVCNLLNTYLAGKLASALFFPTLNIGVILLSMACGILFYKERLRKKECAVLLLGVAAILLLTFG